MKVQTYQAGTVTIQRRCYSGAIIFLCWDPTSSLFCSDVEAVVRFADRTLLGHGLTGIRSWLTLMAARDRLSMIPQEEAA